MVIKPVARVYCLFGLLLIVAGILLSRLFTIQILQGDYYSERADRQNQRPTNLLSERGTIFFQTKDGTLVSAATMMSGFIVAINPRQIVDAELAYEKFNNVVPVDRDFFISRAVMDDPYEVILNRVDEDTVSRLRSSGVPGLVISRERWRHYPAGDFASHAVGYMGYEGNEYAGRYGLERQYETVLRRQPEKTFTQFISGIFTDISSSALGRGVAKEANVVTTIEPTVQRVLTEEIDLIQDKYKPESIGAIIIQPKNGKIVAMGSLPSFDPGARVGDLYLLKNPLVESVYEMGSTIKPLTLAAALDQGVITSTTTYYDAGTIVINNRSISNFDKQARGTVTMQEVLNKSLNTGVVFAMQRLGMEKFRQYMLGFGLGEKTGIDLPNEIGGLVKNLSSRREIEFATASFGQGLALTPLGTARALAALGNGGYLIQPRLVERLERENGEVVIEHLPQITRSVIKESTSEEISRMLVVAVDNALLGGTLKLPHHSVAGKTGTAQIAGPGGGYHEDQFLHSFFTYFPAYDPEFLIFSYMINPRGARYASDTLAPPVMNLSKFLINYYGIPPDR